MTPDISGLIAERASLAGIALTADELEKLTQYYELLARWNQRVNLTAFNLNQPTTAVLDRLITEPLVSKALASIDSGRWFDLGSGGGSPAVPLKIVMPGIELILVESKSRKSAFLREAVRHLHLEGVSVWTGRIESLSEEFQTGVGSLVTVRGVKLDHVLLATAAELLAGGGRLVSFGNSTPPQVEPFPFRYRTSALLPGDVSAVHLFERYQQVLQAP